VCSLTHHYVSAKRLELAKQLLGKGDQPLVHIALTLKFSCQANFTRAFREVTGRTPAQFLCSVGMIAAEPAATTQKRTSLTSGATSALCQQRPLNKNAFILRLHGY
jgi:AraC-like DNA-binding protein